MMCSAPPAEEEIPTVDENGQPLSKSAIKKLMKAAAVAKKKAAKKAEKAAAAADTGAAASGDAADDGAEEEPAPFSFGTPGVLMSDASDASSTRVFSNIRDLGTAAGPAEGSEVWVRGRLYRIRGKGNQCFIVLREQGQYTIQGCFFNNKSYPKQSKAFLAFVQGLTEESIVDVRRARRSHSQRHLLTEQKNPLVATLASHVSSTGGAMDARGATACATTLAFDGFQPCREAACGHQLVQTQPYGHRYVRRSRRQTSSLALRRPLSCSCWRYRLLQARASVRVPARLRLCVPALLAQLSRLVALGALM